MQEGLSGTLLPGLQVVLEPCRCLQGETGRTLLAQGARVLTVALSGRKPGERGPLLPHAEAERAKRPPRKLET